MKSPDEIIDTVGERLKLVVPIQEHASLGKAFCRACIEEAVAEAFKAAEATLKVMGKAAKP